MQSQFQVSFAKARDELLVELKRLNATNIVISSNVETRQDGLPYARSKEPDDPGVARTGVRRHREAMSNQQS